MNTEQSNNVTIQSVIDPNIQLLKDIPPQPQPQPQPTTNSPKLPTISPEQKGNIFRECGISRKSEGFNQFKRSEQTILTAANKHVLAVDIVCEQLEARLLISERAMQTIAIFLRDRLQQEQANVKFLTQKNPPFVQVFKDKDNTVLFPNLSSSLESLNQLHQTQSTSLAKLIQNMEKFIKDKFENNQNNFHKLTSSLIDKIKALKKQTRECLLLSNERSKKMSKTYDEMMSNGGSHKKRSKDLLYSERKFREAVLLQIAIQTELGEETIKYYDEVVKQEFQRLELISSGLKFYVEKFYETYSGSTPSAQVSMVIQKFKDCCTEINKSKENHVDQINIKEIDFIKEALKCQDIGYGQLKNYLTLYPASLLQPTLAQNNPLVLKFFHKLQRDVGTMLTKWQHILIVVSIDMHFLIYDSEDLSIPNQKASYKFAIEHTDIIQKQNKQFLIAELRHTVPGMLYNSHKSVMLKFASQDEFEELQFYINQNKK